MVRLAKISDLRDILNITRSCALDMERQGIFQWNEHYPNQAAFLEDIRRRELHVVEEDGKLRGAVVVSTLMDQEYEPIPWLVPHGNSTYVHRLCVDPRHQGRGLARELMDFAEASSKQRGFASVRLDTFSQNKRNQAFYEQRGYQRLGNIHFPKQSQDPFYCYELVL